MSLREGSEIKECAFFHFFDWYGLRDKTVQPPITPVELKKFKRLAQLRAKTPKAQVPPQQPAKQKPTTPTPMPLQQGNPSTAAQGDIADPQARAFTQATSDSLVVPTAAAGGGAVALTVEVPVLSDRDTAVGTSAGAGAGGSAKDSSGSLRSVLSQRSTTPTTPGSHRDRERSRSPVSGSSSGRSLGQSRSEK